MTLCDNCATQLLASINHQMPEAVTEPEPEPEDPTAIITSKRRIGVELETVYTKRGGQAMLENALPRGWTLQGDGSIRAENAVGGIEIVSPILTGKQAETSITKLCKEAKAASFGVNTSCGYHLHLDAPEFVRDSAYDQKIRDEDQPAHKVFYKFKYRGNVHVVDTLDRIMWERKPNGKEGLCKYKTLTKKINQKFDTNTGPSFYLLRDLWYIYLVFDDVFRAMLPPSRRNNTFCQATGSLYSIETIRGLRDFTELEAVWYKADRRYNKENLVRHLDEVKGYKHGSRYSGFNLEPLLRIRGPKTVEIRYHSPTLKPEKILRWADLHQTILDRVAAGDWDEHAVMDVQANVTHIIRKAEAMCKLFKIKKGTQEYIIERITKFNKLGAKDEDLKDEEVTDSPIGQTSHRATHLEPMYRPNSLTPTGRNSRMTSPSLSISGATRRLRQLQNEAPTPPEPQYFTTSDHAYSNPAGNSLITAATRFQTLLDDNEITN